MRFFEELENRVLVADGAMGTLLYSKGVPKGQCYDELNITNPELIEAIHREYIAAGADIIETNTFGANRYILEKYYALGNKTRLINFKGAQIAKKAASGRTFVAGSIGPITRSWETETNFTHSDYREIFKESILGLLDGEADLIILETFSFIDELIVAYKTVREIAGEEFPIIVSCSFLADGRTLGGIEPEQLADEFQKLKAKIIGTNCGTGPRQTLEIAKKLKQSFDGFISAMPNAGFPTFADGKFLYPSTPEYFASFARRAAKLGVNIIGGCCGTTPEHIKKMKEAVKDTKAFRYQTRKEIVFIPRKPSTFPKPLPRFVEKLKQEFVLSVELDPPKGWETAKIIENCRWFASYGVGTVNIADLPMAKLRMSALAFSAIIKKETDLDIILHITARDRTIMALQSDLLGAYALGIKNILVLRGDPPSVGDYPFATGVFEITSAGIVRLASSFNMGYDGLGNQISSPTDFAIGVAFNQNAHSLENEFKRLEAKLKAGAHFIQTQPVFDPTAINRLSEFARYKDIPVIATVMLIPSVSQAEYFANEVPGMKIPTEYIERMKLSNDPEHEACVYLIELILRLMSFVNGVCIVYPHNRPDLLKEVLSGL